MRWLVLITGIALVLGGLFLGPRDPQDRPLRPVADSATLRETRSGSVVGGSAPSGAQVWLGIPYAAPPVGALRWRAPQEPQAWRNPRESRTFPPACPQFASRLSASRAEPGTLVGSEDCLYLNVFAPSGVAPGDDLPVMVFVHGGGNTIGSTVPYDGSRFVQEQGVVMVTLQYRLGPLGWFSHPALRSASVTPAEASGNFALLDMIAGLRWVRDNIAAFGGDAQRVTLFGESAGGRNIYSLLVAPQARDLFHGAIIQSGFPGTFPVAPAERLDTEPQRGHPNSSSELILRWLSAVSGRSRSEARSAVVAMDDEALRDFLRELDPGTLFAGIERDGSMYRIPALFRDGAVLPKAPLPDVFADPENWNRVPLLVGSNRDEMKLFMALSPEHTRKRLGLLPAPRDPQRYDRIAAYHSDTWKAVGVDLPLTAISANDPDAPLFAYRFDWDDMREGWLLDLPRLLGAAHALELDFLFRPLISQVVPGVFHRGNRESRERLGRAMRDYWAGFAYHGRPGVGRSGARRVWPPWSVGSPRTMLLDEEGDGGVRPEPLAVELADIKRRLGADDLLADRLRCALYVDLFLANNGLPELFSAREYQALGCAQFPVSTLVGASR